MLNRVDSAPPLRSSKLYKSSRQVLAQSVRMVRASSESAKRIHDEDSEVGAEVEMEAVGHKISGDNLPNTRACSTTSASCELISVIASVAGGIGGGVGGIGRFGKVGVGTNDLCRVNASCNACVSCDRLD